MEFPDPQRWVATLENLFGTFFGRLIATVLVAMACLFVALWLASGIWNYGGKTTFDFFDSIIVETITVDNLEIVLGNLQAALATFVWFMVIFGIVVVAILYFLSRALFKRAVSQTVLDDLAKLRNEGIDDVYTIRPTSDSDFDDWKQKYKIWENQILEYIKNHFPKADFLTAQHLGVVHDVRFPSLRYNDEHERLLMFFAKRLEIIEAILMSYRR